MRTISLRQMPDGPELELPSLGYWIKAGFGLGIGAAIVVVCLWLASVTLFFTWINVLARTPIRHTAVVPGASSPAASRQNAKAPATSSSKPLGSSR
jgi:hypothetical protein